MKFLWILSLVLSSQFWNQSLRADDRRGKELEVEIEKIFIPKKGFDDNDNIEAVAVGDLPNPCFTIGRVYTEKTQDGFVVHQMAWKSDEGACGTGDLIDEPVPYFSPVPLGQLNVGSYSLKAGESKAVHFDVGIAASRNIDNFSYAIIQSVSTEQYYASGAPVNIEVRGLLPDCTRLVEPLNAEVLDDVVLILPIVEKTGGPCIHYAKPFKKIYTVTPPADGSYLAHVRSRGGNAVYQPFWVWKRSLTALPH